MRTSVLAVANCQNAMKVPVMIQCITKNAAPPQNVSSITITVRHVIGTIGSTFWICADCEVCMGFGPPLASDNYLHNI